MVMTPQLLIAALSFGEKFGLMAYNQIIAAIHKNDPTAEDWKINMASPNVDKLIEDTEKFVPLSQQLQGIK